MESRPVQFSVQPVCSGCTLYVRRVASRGFGVPSFLPKLHFDTSFEMRDLVHLLPPIRARHASLLRRRRARRALAIAPWAPRGAVGHARRPRRLFFADSGTWPNSPDYAQECNFGSSRPTRRPCVVLVRQGGGAGHLSSPAGARLTGRALERHGWGSPRAKPSPPPPSCRLQKLAPTLGSALVVCFLAHDLV